MGSVSAVNSGIAPPLFSGKPCTQWQYTPPSAVLKMRGFGKKVFWAIIDPIAAVGFLVLFWPLGILASLFCFYRWQKLLVILSESRSKKVKSASCPTCARPVNFWGSTGFECPHCRRLLMQDGQFLYDVS